MSVLLLSAVMPIACSKGTPSDLKRPEARTAASRHGGTRPVEAQRDANSDPEALGIIERLHSNDHHIVARALVASGPFVASDPPDMQLVAEIVQLAEQHEQAALRHAVVEVLGELDAAHRDATVLGALELSLTHLEAHVLSAGLRALRPCNAEPPSSELRVRVLELAEHQNAGVRGQALQLVGECGSQPVPPWPSKGSAWGPRHGVSVRTSPPPTFLPISFREASIARAWAALEDPHPYVRAAACETVAHLGYIQSIHRLIGLLDDHERSAYVLDGWALLNGQRGSTRHEIQGRWSVAESAMVAVEALSAGQLDLKPMDPRRAKASLEANARFIRAWYTEQARDRVPLGSPGPVFPANARYRRTPPSGLH